MTAKEPKSLEDNSVSEPIDLASLDTISGANAGYELELRHPATKAPLGIFITVLGSDSDTFKELMHDRVNDAIRKGALVRQGKDPEIKSSEQLDQEELELLAACTIGFRNIKLDGKILEFSKKNAYDLYRRMPWIKDQVNKAIANVENFIKG
jgi:hypothetical protein